MSYDRAVPRHIKLRGGFFCSMHIRSYMLSNTSILSNILVGTLGRSVRKLFIVCKVLVVLRGQTDASAERPCELSLGRLSTFKKIQ